MHRGMMAAARCHRCCRQAPTRGPSERTLQQKAFTTSETMNGTKPLARRSLNMMGPLPSRQLELQVSPTWPLWQMPPSILPFLPSRDRAGFVPPCSRSGSWYVQTAPSTCGCEWQPCPFFERSGYHPPLSKKTPHRRCSGMNMGSMGREWIYTAFELRQRFRKARNGNHLITTFKDAIKNLQKAPDCRLT